MDGNLHLLTTEQAAARLGQSVRTLKRWRKIQPTPISFCKVGGRVRYPEVAIEDYLARVQIDSPEAVRRRMFADTISDLARRLARLEQAFSAKSPESAKEAA